MRTPARLLLSLAAAAAGLGAFTGSASADFQLNLTGKTLLLTGGPGVDDVTFKAKAGEPSTLQVDVGSDQSIDLEAPKSQVNLIQVFSLGGDDRVTFSTANGSVDAGTTTQVFAGEGDDDIRGGDGNEQLFGGPGADVVSPGGGSDFADLGSEDDFYNWSVGDGIDAVLGGAGSDHAFLAGTNGPDDVRVVAPGGQNVVRVSDQATSLITDLTDVETLQTRLFGGSDTYVAGTGLPSFFDAGVEGGPGKDTIEGGDRADTIAGGTEADTIRAGGGSDTIRWTAGDGDDTIDGGAGGDLLRTFATTGDDQISVERAGVTTDGFGFVATSDVEAHEVLGAAGNDTITLADEVQGATVFAAQGDDTVTDGSGENALFGGPGSDRLSGGAGRDIVAGEADSDSLTGGAGVDTFVCGKPDTDTIEDRADEDVLAPDCDAAHPLKDTPVQPAAPPADAGPAQPPVDPGAQPAIPAGFLGFAKPTFKASLKALNVTVRNTHTQPITVRLSGSERDGLKKAAGLKAVTRTIPAGGKVTYKLATPKKLKTRLAKQLAKRRKITRQPALTLVNTATGGKLTVKPKLTVKRRRAR